MQNTAAQKLGQYDNEHVASVRRIPWIGVIVNVVLTVIQFALGIIGHSQAVIADTFHTLSDLVTDFMVLFGVHLWSKLPDEEHPYGHRRIETLITTFIGMAMVGAAIGIGYNALVTIGAKDSEKPLWIACIGALLAIIFKEILYHWTVAVGRREKSPALMAKAWHHRSDAFSSIPVVIAVTVAVISPRWAFVDHVGAFVVSIFILYTSWEILRPIIFEIIETGASKKQRKKIRDIAVAVKGVESVHALRTRRVGPGWYVDLNIQVAPQMSVKRGHEISEVVKQDLLGQGPDVLDVIVHLEPYDNSSE